MNFPNAPIINLIDYDWGILIGIFFITILYSFYKSCRQIDDQIEKVNNFIFSEQALHATEKNTQKLRIDNPPAYELVIQMPPDYAPTEV